MQPNLRDTLNSFQHRKELIHDQGFPEIPNLFKEAMRERVGARLSEEENRLFFECRAAMNQCVELLREKKIEDGRSGLLKMEEVLSDTGLSFECRILITSFYSAALAYYRYKVGDLEAARALSLKAMAIDNYLVQILGYEFLELHKVVQIINMADIYRVDGNLKAAHHILFGLVYAYSETSSPEGKVALTNLDSLNEKFAGFPLRPLFLEREEPAAEMDPVYKTTLPRFLLKSQGHPLMNRFSIDFSALPFELKGQGFDLIILTLIRYTQNCTASELKELFDAYGFRAVNDLEGHQRYFTQHLFLSSKLHWAHENHREYLNAVKAFCDLTHSEDFWGPLKDDFLAYCSNCEF